MKDFKKLSRAVSTVLTVLFLGFVFVALGATMATNGMEIIDSVRLRSNLEAYLPEDPNALDMLNARIQSFTGSISEQMWLKDEMGYLNSGFQYSLGKDMITTGNRNMVTLTTGHLHDLQDYVPMEEATREIIDLQDTLPQDVPFLFVYEHPTIYQEDMIPAGYSQLDHSIEMADEIVGYLNEGGVPLIDSREVLAASGYPMEDLLMYTDQHWSTLAAMVMAQSITEKINTMTDAGLDPSLLDLEQMNTLVHEDRFIGKYGQRVGTAFITPDDLVEYWPKYETHLKRHTLKTTTTEDVEGTFREVVVRADRIEPLPGKTWNKLGYTYYGQVEAYEMFTNELAPDFTILLLKDSYSAPIGAFLSLVAGDVVSVDLRQAQNGTIYDWIEKTNPDMIVMAYSMQMLRDDEYAFAG